MENGSVLLGDFLSSRDFYRKEARKNLSSFFVVCGVLIVGLSGVGLGVRYTRSWSPSGSTLAWNDTGLLWLLMGVFTVLMLSIPLYAIMVEWKAGRKYGIPGSAANLWAHNDILYGRSAKGVSYILDFSDNIECLVVWASSDYYRYQFHVDSSRDGSPIHKRFWLYVANEHAQAFEQLLAKRGVVLERERAVNR